MNLLENISTSVKASFEEKSKDFEYRRALNTKFARAVERPCISFPERDWQNTLIAEVKLNSPSGGRLAKEYENPADIASAYVEGGAQAISVLTEPLFFEGNLKYLEEIRFRVKSVPLLMKDFVFDEFQIKEGRAYGADGILLIAHLVGDELSDLIDYADSLGMWALVETHSKDEVEAAISAGAKIIGVNNRDLETLEVDLDASVNLCKHIPDNLVFVVESGITYPEDIRYLKDECVRKPDAYLVGTSVMMSEDKKEKLKELIEA